MKRLCIVFLSLILCGLVSVFAATGTVNGKIKDSKTNKGLEYVNIRIEEANTKKFINTTVTDADGVYRLGSLKAGTYNVVVSLVGYFPQTRKITIATDESVIDLSDISISENSKMLDEVVVVGQQSAMRFEIDKRVFNVAQDLSSIGGSASDILINIPSVDVDAEGTVALRGNTSVTIWINGKSSGITSENSAQILEQLPAESIERVEIITNPSAKYNPEGTSGIINIVLKENRKAGYYGSVQAGVDTQGGYNVGGNINYTASKFDAYLNISHRVRQRVGGGYTNRDNLDQYGNTASFLNQIRDDNERGASYFLRTGASYKITPKDQVGFNLFGMLSGDKRESTINYLSNVPNSFVSSFRTSDEDNDMKIFNLNLYYKKEFSENHTLNVSASTDNFNRGGTPVYNQTSYMANGTSYNTYQRQSSDSKRENYELQIDYSNEFGNQNKIEAGYKGETSHNVSPVETYSGSSESTATLDRNLYNDFTYNQDIHALYATYSKKINNFGAQIGLRGEYTKYQTRSLAYGETDKAYEGSDYFSLYPSMFLSYALPNNNELQLNYSRRVSRPRGWNLNPFVNITDSTNISYGNPFLKPQYANALEFNYIKNWSMHTLSASLYYRSSDNVIQRINYLDGNVMKTTFENIAKNESAGTEFIVKNKIGKFLDVTSTVGLYYNILHGYTYMPFGTSKAIVQDDNENFAWNGKIMANAILPYNISFQVTGNYDSKQIMVQGYRKPSGSVDLGLRKSFLNNKLNVALGARDLFNTRKREMVTSGDGFYQEQSFRRNSRRFNLTLTYSFGNMGKTERQREGEDGASEPQLDMNGDM